MLQISLLEEGSKPSAIPGLPTPWFFCASKTGAMPATTIWPKPYRLVRESEQPDPIALSSALSNLAMVR